MTDCRAVERSTKNEMRQKYQIFSEVELRLIHAAREAKAWSHKEFLDELEKQTTWRTSRETLSRYLNRKKGPPPEARECFERVLGLEPYTLIRPTRGKMVGKLPFHDLKNRLNDPAIQCRLLTMTRLPSFAEAVWHSEEFVATSLEDKFKKPDHYFQPAAILRVTWPGQAEPHVLTYLREPKVGTLKYTLSTGKAVLFGASYRIRVAHAPCPMNVWLELVGVDDGNASREFTHGGSSVLVRLLSCYKLDLSNFDVVFTPLGVVTNAPRASKSTAYTAYAFLGELKFNSRPRGTELARLSQDGSKLFLEKERADPEELCIDTKGRPLCMDIAVWNALQSGDSQATYQTARFRRGFNMVGWREKGRTARGSGSGRGTKSDERRPNK